MAKTDLFELQRQALEEKEAPLAARMRPRTLDEFVGQEHIVGPGRLLRRAIQADQLSSVIFYGPPGTGKTTLARVIANTTRAHFVAINAVLAGVQDIRDAIAVAQEQRGKYGRRTILFVDEVHRFNKAQQDALLPWVENGTVILIGATTENPYFSVNRPLVSRSRIFQLKPLTDADLYAIARRALADPERGYGRLNVVVDDDALDHLVNVANGDARALLNALELAVETTPPAEDGAIHVTLAVAEESIQRRAVLYDKEGDYHFDTISAFIKSLRGSDPDAALYWLAKMVYAGEDPRFIFRRMLIFAAEDVGMADPHALPLTAAAAEAFDRVGLPEGRFHLSLAAIYLATAPKSNSTLGFFDALATVEAEREAEVPAHLRDASRDREGFGHGAGYLYPHAYRDHWVAQQYLPDALQGKVFYQPTEVGAEARIKAEVERRREAQLAAMVEGQGVAPPEVLTFTGDLAGRARERWLQRAVSGVSQRLAAQRDRVVQAARLQRHHLVLDVNAGSGLLTWEALRRAAEGGVVALAHTAQDAEALRQQAERLPEVERPLVLQGDLDDLPALLNGVARWGSVNSRLPARLRFDAILGRNALTRHPDKAAAARLLANLLAEQGRISLAETVPAHTQRLYRLVDLAPLGPDLAAAVADAEEAIYRQADDPLVNWDEEALRLAFAAAGLTVEIAVEREQSELLATPAVLSRWFAAAAPGQRPSYGDRLRRRLSEEDAAAVEALFRGQLANRTVAWETTVVYLVAYRQP
ncbi:MAG: AAA family ATPase [Caldilineales bacterium]|nr:AAA family ATPase [Caldilineales bacterium]MDW8317118.1 AAA family ATPase [Anaerolineae bacterium]